jgi:hypothetical protein
LQTAGPTYRRHRCAQRGRVVPRPLVAAVVYLAFGVADALRLVVIR